MFKTEEPYNDLPLLPPKHDLESKAVLKQTIAARASLAKLAGKGDQIPHQGILINSIVLQEARDSSEIENIFTTQDDLFRGGMQNLDKGSPAAKEVHQYREALWHGFNAIQQRPICTNSLVEIVQIIKKTNLDIRTGTDTRIVNGRGEFIYTPPVGEKNIRDLMANLEMYIHDEESDVDPLVRLAVIHYQFEAIHPFPDGNGRTGRILNLLFLVSRGLLDIPVLYLSSYIIKNKDEYYKRLRGVTENGDWESWILYMLHAIETTAKDTTLRIQNITNLMTECGEHVQQNAASIYSKELLELIFREPYCKIDWLVRAGIAKRQTASTYLNKLVEIGVLSVQKHGRDKYFLNDKLLELLH